MQLRACSSQVAATESEISAQIFHMENEIGANKLIFFRHQVLWDRDANCSSTTHEGRSGIAGPLPTVSKEARSFSD
jgi:hypothetical protein